MYLRVFHNLVIRDRNAPFWRRLRRCGITSLTFNGLTSRAILARVKKFMRRRGLRASVVSRATRCSADECTRWWSWPARALWCLCRCTVSWRNIISITHPAVFNRSRDRGVQSMPARRVSSADLTLDLFPRCMTATTRSPQRALPRLHRATYPFVPGQPLCAMEIACGTVAQLHPCDAPSPGKGAFPRHKRARVIVRRRAMIKGLGAASTDFRGRFPLRPVPPQGSQFGDKSNDMVAIPHRSIMAIERHGRHSGIGRLWRGRTTHAIGCQRSSAHKIIDKSPITFSPQLQPAFAAREGWDSPRNRPTGSSRNRNQGTRLAGPSATRSSRCAPGPQIVWRRLSAGRRPTAD
jgi:hypothetical protein